MTEKVVHHLIETTPNVEPTENTAPHKYNPNLPQPITSAQDIHQALS